MVDLGLKTLIPLNRAIDKPNQTQSVLYRITVKGDDSPAKAFAEDSRQVAHNVRGDTFELHVRAVREPVPTDKPGKVTKEYLKSCFFVDSDNPRIQELTRQAVGAETDAWKKRGSSRAGCIAPCVTAIRFLS